MIIGHSLAITAPRAAVAAAPAWAPTQISTLFWNAQARSLLNNTTGGVCVQLQDLSTRNNHMTGAAAGNRPNVITSSRLNPTLSSANRAALQFVKASTHWLRKTGASIGGTAGPWTMAILLRQVTWTSGGIISAYGAGNRPQLRQAGVSNQVSFLASSTPDSITVGNSADGGTTFGGFGDGLFRIVLVTWDGANQVIYRENLQTQALIQEDTDVNANATIADGGTFSLGASVAGVLPIDFEFVEGIAYRGVDTSLHAQIYSYLKSLIGTPFASPASSAKEIIPTGDSITEGTDTNPSSYRRFLWGNISGANGAFFCGTRTTRLYDQPAGYPSGHEGRSGDTIQAVSDRVVGAWTGNNVLLGQAGDPGAGNRGGYETIAARADGQGGGHQNGGVVALLHVGTNDASSGAIDTAAYTRLVERMCNVHGRLKRVYCAKLIGRTDNGAANTRIDTFNIALPAVVAALVTAGYPAVTADLSTGAGFNTGTMLLADGLHPNATGGQWMADQWYAAMQANGDLT